MNFKEIDKEINRVDRFLKKTNIFIEKSNKEIADWKRNNPKKEKKEEKL